MLHSNIKSHRILVHCIYASIGLFKYYFPIKCTSNNRHVQKSKHRRYYKHAWKSMLCNIWVNTVLSYLWQQRLGLQYSQCGCWSSDMTDGTWAVNSPTLQSPGAPQASSIGTFLTHHSQMTFLQITWEILYKKQWIQSWPPFLLHFHMTKWDMRGNHQVLSPQRHYTCVY